MARWRRSVSDRDGDGQSSPERKTFLDRRGSTEGNRDGADGQSARRTLQRRHGNQTIQRLVNDGAIHPNLEVGDPDDEYEREADRVAEKVLAERDPPSGRPADDSGRTVSGPGVDRSVRRTEVDDVDDAMGGGRASLPLGGGRPLSDPVRSFFEPRFGRDFGDVRIHTDDRADDAARSIDAEAFAYGRNVAFRSGAYRPETESGRRLLAHELTHVVQQTRSVPRREPTGSFDGISTGANDIQRQDADGDRAGSRESFPWTGRIEGAWSVALRETPEKRAESPHRNTLADLPRGTPVTVVGRDGGWLHVEATVDGEQVSGYVSQELVATASSERTSDDEAGGESTDSGPDVLESLWEGVSSLLEGTGEAIDATLPNVLSRNDAFSILNRARNVQSHGEELSPTDQYLVDAAIERVESFGKYEVDRSTYRVSFEEPSGDEKIQIETIEDFILFVEAVEETYSDASPAEIASEVRQMWFSDVNWEVMVASQGITRKLPPVFGRVYDIQTSDATDYVDLESPDNPLAESIDIQALTTTEEETSSVIPGLGGGSERVTRKTTLDTPMGPVRISHVMAGIDAALSGSPGSYPVAFLEARGHDSENARVKYETLREASRGDVRDFATWAGDLAQAYANYLDDRWNDGNESASLEDWVEEKATKAELLGDIHGYVAVKTFEETPTDRKPAGEMKVSDVLRNLYLGGDDSARSYRDEFESTSGKTGEDLAAFIEERTVRFARPWYAKLQGKIRLGLKGLGRDEDTHREAALAAGMEEFDDLHRRNEQNADGDNTLSGLAEEFLKMVDGRTE